MRNNKGYVRGYRTGEEWGDHIGYEGQKYDDSRDFEDMNGYKELGETDKKEYIAGYKDGYKEGHSFGVFKKENHLGKYLD